MTDGRAKPLSVPLACLGGEEPSPELVLGLKDLALFPDTAKRQLWNALGPVVQYPPPKDLEAALDTFRRKHEIAPGRFARAMAACRALLRAAGQHDCGREAFEADLGRLDRGDELAALLVPHFEAAIAAIKQQILYGSLGDHGKLLVGVDWRVDAMLHSNRGHKLGTTVTQLTLRYVEGKEEKRITLQALPDLIEQLERMCRQIVGPKP